MRILHYSLGLPPYRSGGLTKYCTDLMVEQAKSNNKVFLLFPGKMNFIKKDRAKIKFYRDYKNVKVYELVNPLPVPILNGIFNPKLFTKSCDKEVLKTFLENIRIDIVHIHTLMGLYKEFLEVCNELDIKIVFTSHDYFGLCPKVNFINYQGELCEEINFEECSKCNLRADSIKKIKILQSRPYRYIKDKGIIDKLKKYLKSNSNANLQEEKQCIAENTSGIDEYIALNKYYHSMFKYIDRIFFNSEVAKSIYRRYIDIDGVTIPITHGGIKDNRKIRYYNQSEILRLTYLGPYKEYKGFKFLTDVMRELEMEGYNKIILNAYGDTNPTLETPKNMVINGKYNYLYLSSIFENTDMLIVPSIWDETFGFITLESLSYGVPVLVTNKVGSKDLICDSEFTKGEIVNLCKDMVKNRIKKIYKDKSILQNYNHNIVNDDFEYLLDKHCSNVYSEYKKLLEE
ncbi:glycosyltransferase [Paraclostridium bifermentans]|uniref:Glycosyltransferase n=1 Tax=Paraclostridium bifermentans TaxID=1490 RepID=A0ABY8R2N0_PARBF|nr:glycosyltransferase [Paraclostridium bifermentans]